MIRELQQPEAGSEPLHFPDKFAISRFSQLKTILWKNRQVYWRYTGVCCRLCRSVLPCPGSRSSRRMLSKRCLPVQASRHQSTEHMSCCCAAEYNTLRVCFIFVMALFFGTAFWQMGERKSSRTDIFTIMGSLFISTMARFLSSPALLSSAGNPQMRRTCLPAHPSSRGRLVCRVAH